MAATPPVEELLRHVTAHLSERRRFPESTYRVQFHAGFTFRDATALVPYLHELGITDLYASPYLKARPGSRHGYDISDHRTLNPEIGTPEEHAALSAALCERGMGQLLDIVPNHMGIVGNENAWWNDVLENGPSSPYAGFFDIDWLSHKPALREKVLLPILGEPYGKVLEAGQIQLRFEAGVCTVHYFDHRFPVAPGTYEAVLRHRLPELEQALGPETLDLLEYQSILTALSYLPPRNETDPAKVAERQREKEVIKRRLAVLTEQSETVRRFIEENVRLFNGEVGQPHSFDLLDNLLNQQAYRLAFWRVASDEINYRRFFDVNELAALSMEKPEVFAAAHELVLRLLCEGKVTGLRIDHPDGLYDPREYLQRLQEEYALARARGLTEGRPEFREIPWPELEGPLRELLRRERDADPGSVLHRPLYVVVEKILDKDEPLAEDWPVFGSTGYAFVNVLGGLFVDPESGPALSRIYHRATGMDPSFREFVYDKKFLILQVALSSELHMLARQLDNLAERHRWSRDFTLNSLRHALREVIACFPVYRSYITGDDIHEQDRRYVETAVARARRRNPAISSSLFSFVRDMLLLRYPEGASDADRAEQRRFVGKFQQVTGPVMAKGLEDTAFYVYNRLVSLNEVGGDPGRFGVPPESFHAYGAERQRKWPYALSTTSTHDTKRSEDVRARLNVLSELPREWQKAVVRWKRLNARHRARLEGLVAPEANDEYLFYQTLIGAWPLEEVEGPFGEAFVKRIQEYMEKALHEAKVHTSWVNPNPEYDAGVARFVSRVLDARKNGRFLEHFRAFQRRVSHFGLFNALAQVLFKVTAPGVADVYQGTELWDLSLVDPDNRRPVDYDCRRRLLAEVRAGAAAAGERLPEFCRELTRAKEDGRIKLYVVHRALHARREQPELFSTGEYQPAEPQGSRRQNLVGFVRRRDRQCAIVVAPRLLTQLIGGPDELPLGTDVWQDTTVFLPGVDPGRRCRNVFTGEVLTAAEREGRASLAAAELFASFPVALLVAQD